MDADLRRRWEDRAARAERLHAEGKGEPWGVNATDIRAVLAAVDAAEAKADRLAELERKRWESAANAFGPGVVPPAPLSPGGGAPTPLNGED